MTLPPPFINFIKKTGNLVLDGFPKGAIARTGAFYILALPKLALGHCLLFASV